MVVESDPTRFASRRQTILDVLDPIHRSLLLNNSTYEQLTETTIDSTKINTNPIDNRRVTNITQTDYTSSKFTAPQQQQPVTLIENKHYCDESESLTKPDAAYVNNINGKMAFDEADDFTDASECGFVSSPKNRITPVKNIHVRIMANKKRAARKAIIREEALANRPTDTSSSEYVETDSEVESSESTERKSDSVSCSNDNQSSNGSDSNNSDSSEDAVTTCSTGSEPMIHIIQEITERRLVTSTVHINREKVKSYNSRCHSKASSKQKKPRWQNTQKVIDDNVCNEILDQNSNDESELSPVADCIRIGELKAKPKYTERTIGKLLQKRLSRSFDQGNHIIQQTLPPNRICQSFNLPTVKPPVKPPRTFTSLSKSSSNSSRGDATTMTIEDFHKSSRTSIPPRISPCGGWVFDEGTKVTSKPTCPTFEEINGNDNAKKIGWTAHIPKRDECLQVLNMLNGDCLAERNMTTANLLPEPQSHTQHKEEIDQVDSSSTPIPPARRSKYFNMSTDLNDTMYSTPIKRSYQFLSSSTPNTVSKSTICQKCRSEVIKSSSARSSFGKGAIKRTKLFLKASKNILTRPKPTKMNQKCENQYENDYDDDLENEETPTKLKSNTTAEFNSNYTPKYEKKTVKTLELPGDDCTENTNIESPRRILDKFLTSVKRTPPKKPVRQSLLFKDSKNAAPCISDDEAFNFERIIDSPKSKQNSTPFMKKGFKLSPRKLFRPSNEHNQGNSYQSFEANENDNLKLCISEYLRDISSKLDDERDAARFQTFPRYRNRIRTLSTSSDAIDHMPQRVVQIDCHPEPLYAEINSHQPIEPNHILVNNKAIYATVDKTKKKTASGPMGINDGNQECLSNSNTSLNQPCMHNSLADSILNMLETMHRNDYQREITEDSQVITIEDENELEGGSPYFINSQITEQPTMKCISERLQQAPEENNIISDNTSIDTYFTEDIYRDVVCGDSVNNDIAALINQLENMDVSTHNLVISETTDESDCDDRLRPTNDIEDVDEEDSMRAIHGSYVEENNKLEAVDAIDTLHHNCPNCQFDRAKKTSKTATLHSPLRSAPSMVEIPDQHMLELTNQIIFQRKIRSQLKHAIEICRTTKEFECSTELIEAERLMLLSAKKEMCAKHELRRIDYEENGLTNNPAKCGGSVTITNIEFAVKADEMFDNYFQVMYVCVCSYRDQVLATYAQESVGNKVEFKGLQLNLSNLDCLFNISIEVHVLRLRKTLRNYSHESKYHLNKTPKKSLFANSVKLFSTSPCSRSSPSKDFDETRFRLRGFSAVSAETLSTCKFEIIQNTSWPQNHTYRCYNTKSLDFTINDQFANMVGPMRVEFICQIILKDSGLEGFLSVAEGRAESKPYWCRLNGCSLECWSDSIDCRKMKRPLLSIDLRKCTNETTQLDDTKFLLDIFNDQFAGDDKKRINRFWIGSNSQTDLVLWLTEINRILKFIKDWNI